MSRNMAVSIIEHERIITTLPKAKAIKPQVEKLFDVLGPRFAERPGGYCRIIKLAKRRLGDAGERAMVEFVERTPAETADASDDEA